MKKERRAIELNLKNNILKGCIKFNISMQIIIMKKDNLATFGGIVVRKTMWKGSLSVTLSIMTDNHKNFPTITFFGDLAEEYDHSIKMGDNVVIKAYATSTKKIKDGEVHYYKSFVGVSLEDAVLYAINNNITQRGYIYINNISLVGEIVNLFSTKNITIATMKLVGDRLAFIPVSCFNGAKERMDSINKGDHIALIGKVSTYIRNIDGYKVGEESVVCDRFTKIEPV